MNAVHVICVILILLFLVAVAIATYKVMVGYVPTVGIGSW